MSRALETPVQTQMAVGALSEAVGSEFPMKNRTDGRPAGWKRVFVQTDNGSVMGIELVRGDNAHTVKRKMQIALNVSTADSSLTYGDQVLNNDLSSIRNDSPLLLTRNSFHRSSSTPCLSPREQDLQQIDRSGLIEILGCSSQCSRLKQLVKDVVKAIRNGVEPVPVGSGMGGAYYFKNVRGDNVAIVKPTDEEPFAPNNPKGFVGKCLGQPGLKSSVRVGETGFREVAAYLLDSNHFANVPLTALVKITHSIFHVNDVDCGVRSNDKKSLHSVSKIASFQQYVSHDYDASDHGTSSFPISAVHHIGILDIRIFNTDRHAGNLLVRKQSALAGKFGAQTELIPIDHGLCLPESLEDPYFEWIHWPQSSIPFSEDELEYIASLDPLKDCEMLRRELPMIREACLRVLVLSTMFLKEAAAFGLSLSEIGEMMSRQFTGREEEPSELEVICIEAKKLVDEQHELLSPVSKSEDSDLTQFQIDCDEDQASPESPPFHSFKLIGNSFGYPLPRLEESIDEEDDEFQESSTRQEDENPCPPLSNKWLPSVSGLSASFKGVSVSAKSKPYFSRIPKWNSVVKTNTRGDPDLQRGSRSATEQLPPSLIFVRLSDMGDEDWSNFLQKFLELLPDAFVVRKRELAGQWQNQRLGTSCQF